MVAASRTRGGLTALPAGAGIAGLRGVYQDFKYPPDIIVGAMQTRGDAPATHSVPVYGRNLLRAWKSPGQTIRRE